LFTLLYMRVGILLTSRKALELPHHVTKRGGLGPNHKLYLFIEVSIPSQDIELTRGYQFYLFLRFLDGSDCLEFFIIFFYSAFIAIWIASPNTLFNPSCKKNITTYNTQPPRYNWNIVESGVKHHKHTSLPIIHKMSLNN
jgi:hypothetical protein